MLIYQRVTMGKAMDIPYKLGILRENHLYMGELGND